MVKICIKETLCILRIDLSVITVELVHILEIKIVQLKYIMRL